MSSPSLYVCSKSGSWLETVLGAAAEEFSVRIVKCQVSEPQCLAELGHPPERALILVDSTLESNIEDAVRALRRAGWRYVVVVAARPTWKQARAVLRDVGGFDYWAKTYDSNVLYADLARCWKEMDLDQ